MGSQLTSPELWRELLSAATDFRRLAPWDWMTDDMLFGVQDPATGTVGYCCILGALGEVFALNVYLGREGLESYYTIYRQGMQGNERDGMYIQRLLMASFEDRNDLQKQDVDLLKALDLTFRGRQEWPQFRDYSPGLYPWFIDDAQALFLTHALRQACEVAGRAKGNPELLSSDEEDMFLVRVPQVAPDGLSWTDAWLPAESQTTSPTILPLPTKRDLKALKGIPVGSTILEAEFWHVPTTIQEKPTIRPYFPKLLMGVENASGLVVVQDLFRPDMPLAAVQSGFIRSLAHLSELPGEIRVRRDDLLNIASPIGRVTGIRVEKAQSLPGLEEAWDALDEHLTSRNS